MIKIKLHNTLTRKKQTFVPLDENNVRLYLCGPTVYDRAHLGNARNVIMFDVLYRLLIETYGIDSITYVRNFTDIDDKINNKSLESGRPIDVITSETIKWYLEDMAALGNLEPNLMPRATDYIPQMINYIELLIKRGFAYTDEGHVLFSVSNYKNYGRLSGRSIEDMIAGARVEVASYKRNPMDFVLWKPSEKICQAGKVLGEGGDQVGTSSVRLWLMICLVPLSIFMAVVTIYNFHIMKMR